MVVRVGIIGEIETERAIKIDGIVVEGERSGIRGGRIGISGISRIEEGERNAIDGAAGGGVDSVAA